jgi:hypothetical protein
MSVEVAHIYAMTLAGGSLLIEPVPVAAGNAAQSFSSPLFTEIIRQICDSARFQTLE